MDEYEWALSLFLFHYYEDMRTAAYQVAPPLFGALTTRAARLCQHLCPQEHPVPDAVTNVLISQGRHET